MTRDEFLLQLQEHTKNFAEAVSTKEGEWIVKGFIDIYRKVYTVSVDTKIISKVLELLLFPMFVDFANAHDLTIELCPQQNFYPDLTFSHLSTQRKFAVDIKSTYRVNGSKVNGMTLGAFTGYFRNRDSNKNTLYPYGQYNGHFALGVIYSQSESIADERSFFTVDDLDRIPSVIRDFQFFAQPKYRIASSRPGSGNTKNIGSVTEIAQLLEGSGPFAELGEDVYDDYWMFYLTRDMAAALEVKRPYANLKSYLDFKKRGANLIAGKEKEIAAIEDSATEQGEPEQGEVED